MLMTSISLTTLRIRCRLFKRYAVPRRFLLDGREQSFCVLLHIRSVITENSNASGASGQKMAMVETGYGGENHRFTDKTDEIDHNALQRNSNEEVALLHREDEQQAGLHDEQDGDLLELDQGFGLGFLGLAALTLPSQAMVVPPLNYAMVSEGVFRSGYPIACNFPFLQNLGLRSILCLCPDSVLPASLEWAREAGVRMEMCDLGENSHPFVSMPLTAMSKAVDFLCDHRNRPILVHCLSGKTQTGCAVGCLRRRQNWSLSAIFDEYARFAGPSAKPLDMQFIELFE